MNKYASYMYIIFLIIVSCTRELDYSPPYEGDKLVINGYLSPDEGAMIKITHSINPVGKYLYSDSILVKDAVATLYENGEDLINLKYLGRGYYGLPDIPQINLSVGNKYKLIVKTELYGKAESGEITIPPHPVFEDIRFERKGEIFNNYESGLFSFFVSNPSEKDSYFFIETVTVQNEHLYFDSYKKKEGELYFESCEAIVNNTFVYSNEYGFANNLHQYTIPLENFNDKTFSNSLVVRIGTVSSEFYEYAKSYNELSGLEYGFAEPPILKSNIIGGYGLFYAKNQIIFPIPSSQ